MRAFLLRFIQAPSRRATIRVPAENKHDYLFLFGLIQRVRRLAQAYLALRRVGFANEGDILVRSALEHAVAAQWAYLAPGGMDRLHISLARAQADLASNMIGYSSDPEWAAREKELRASIPAGRGLPKFSGRQGIMADLDSVKFLAVSYSVLSQVGHVTHQAPLDHVVEIDGIVTLRTVPEARENQEVLYALTGFCMLAAWLSARLEDDAVEILRLKDLSVQLHVPWRLDTHLPAARGRFPGEDNGAGE